MRCEKLPAQCFSVARVCIHDRLVRFGKWQLGAPGGARRWPAACPRIVQLTSLCKPADRRGWRFLISGANFSGSSRCVWGVHHFSCRCFNARQLHHSRSAVTMKVRVDSGDVSNSRVASAGQTDGHGHDKHFM